MASIVRMAAASAIALGASLFAASTQAAPAAPLGEAAASVSAFSDVRHRARPHRRHRPVYSEYRSYGGPAMVYVTPHAYAYGAPVRGFDDPGFVRQGNIPSCAVDLGYGRYESCDK
jgi:hypothetical protein